MSTILKPVRNRSLSDDVSDAVREAIFSGRFKPGSPLREMHLAKELDVSQKTVRDALVKLERYGLVVRVPNKETTVTRYTRREVRQRLTLRATLEEIAALEAAKLMKQSDYATLDGQLHLLTGFCRDARYFEAAQADLDFHRYIWASADNETLYAVLDQMAVSLFAFVSIMRSVCNTGMENAPEQHRELLDALKSKKAARISRAVRGHFANFYDDFLNSDVESLEELVAQQAA
ncbi:MAG: GntR family transcriptional regulator [Blastocatellia bacterium]